MAKDLVLVTGAPGWLGNRLVEVLRKDGRKVRCLVLKGSNTGFLESLHADIVEGDLLDKGSLADATDGVRTVFHCAGLIHPKKPGELYLVNRDGTRNILEASVKSGVTRFIYVSSNSAQGVARSREELMQESDPPRPYTDYGKSKHQAELVVGEFQRSGSIETVVIRPTWYYGPGAPDRLVKLIKMIRGGNPLIFGDGRNLRSMTYIDNCIDGLLLAEKTAKANGETYWIADEKNYETIEIYRTIADYFGVTLTPRYVPGIISRSMEKLDMLLGMAGIYEINVHVAGEMTRNISCSIGKAKRELGYKPRFALKEGVKNTIEWCIAKGLIEKGGPAQAKA